MAWYPGSLMDWYPGSLLPPDVDEDSDGDPPKMCLLDRQPFLGDRTNANTARYSTNDDDDMVIQVSFFALRPPRVSYILAWSFGTYFTDEPRVVCTSTDGGLVLLSLAIHTERWTSSEYYIYQPGGGGGAPSLELIPQPSGGRFVDQYCRAGLLSHAHGGYHVVTLAMEAKGEFDLQVFSSDTQNWTLKKPVLVLEQDGAADALANCMTYKAIALGTGGFMAFVDLWNGILICDVLHGGERPELRYLPLPPTVLRQPPVSCYPLDPRDIAISVSGDTVCIKLVEVVSPLTSSNGGWCIDTWIATTTTMSPWRQLKCWWREESTDGAQFSVAHGVRLDGLLDLDHGDGNDKPTLACLFVDKPMMSLDQDNLVCFLAKNQISESQVWLISVDMAKKKLQGVNRIDHGRSTALFYSTFSGHLNTI